ncbi:alpha/beta hydrolase [bacterium]|nr:alpha/beta hydrolase [bacterium]
MQYAIQLSTLPSSPRLFTLGELSIPRLGRKRRVDVYLPIGYERARLTRYPVMYMWDGQNLFEHQRAFMGAWRIGASLDLLTAAGELPPMIVVGIDNGGEHRLSEQSPWPDTAFNSKGEGDDFLSFVTDVVKPTVDRTLRTKPDRDFTAVAGSSMGGLTSLYALYQAPEVFGRAAAFSPSLHFAKAAIFDYLKERPKPDSARLYLDVGGREVGRAERSRPITNQARRLDAILRSQGWTHRDDYFWLVDPKGTHSEACWATRFPAAMRFLWGDLL